MDLGDLKINITMDTGPVEAGTEKVKQSASTIKNSFSDTTASVIAVNQAFELYDKTIGKVQDSLIEFGKYGLKVVDDMKVTTIGIAGTLSDVVKGSSDQVRAAYQQNLLYAHDMYGKLEIAAAKYFASGKEMIEAWQILSTQGITLGGDKDVDNLGLIVDKIKVMTNGMTSSVQIAKELHAVLMGYEKPTDYLVKAMAAQNAGWKEGLDLAKAQGNALEYIASYFQGMKFGVADVAQTMTAQMSTMSTQVGQITRLGFTEMFTDAVSAMTKLNAYLLENKTIIADVIAGPWATIKEVLTFFPTLRLASKLSPNGNPFALTKGDVNALTTPTLNREAYTAMTDEEWNNATPEERLKLKAGYSRDRSANKVDPEAANLKAMAELSEKITGAFKGSDADRIADITAKGEVAKKEIADQAKVNPEIEKVAEWLTGRVDTSVAEMVASINKKDGRADLKDYKATEGIQQSLNKSSDQVTQYQDQIDTLTAQLGGNTLEANQDKNVRSSDRNMAGVMRSYEEIIKKRTELAKDGKAGLGDDLFAKWWANLDKQAQEVLIMKDKNAQLLIMNDWYDRLNKNAAFDTSIAALKQGAGSRNARDESQTVQWLSDVRSANGDEALIQKANEKAQATKANDQYQDQTAILTSRGATAASKYDKQTATDINIELLQRQKQKAMNEAWGNDELVKATDQEWDEKTRKAGEQTSQDYVGGWKSGMDQYRSQLQSPFQTMQTMAESCAKGMESSFSDFFFGVMTGKMKTFADYATSMLQSIEKAIANAMAQKAVGSVMKAWSLFHDGGMVGEGGSGRTVMAPAGLLAAAPRFHDGLMPDEFPAILQQGEMVIPKNMVGQAGSSAGKGQVDVIIHNEGGDDMKVTRSTSSFDFQKQVVEVWIDAHYNNKCGLRSYTG